MQGPHTEYDPGLAPAPGDAGTDPAEIVTTYRVVRVYTEDRWVGGTVLAWHRDHQGWRCLLDWTPAPDRHYQTWVRYDSDRIRPAPKRLAQRLVSSLAMTRAGNRGGHR